MNWVLSALIFCNLNLYAQNTPLYLFGGGTRDPQALQEYINHNKAAKVLVITWSTQEPDATFDAISKDLYSALASQVFQAVHVTDSKSKKLFLKQLGEATHVFFSGGDQNRALDIIDRFNLRRILQFAYDSRIVFAGTSAGTALMSEISMTGKADLEIIGKGNTEVRAGLGLTAFLVDQHFLVRDRYNRLASLLLDYPAMTALGVDENSSVRIWQKKLRTYGPTVLTYMRIEKGSIKRREISTGIEIPVNLNCQVYFN